jgi:hypothetical protein
LKAFATALGPGAEAVGVTNVGLADLVFDPQREGGVSCEGLLVPGSQTPVLFSHTVCRGGKKKKKKEKKK